MTPQTFTFNNQQIAEILAEHASREAGIADDEKWSASIRTVTDREGLVTITVTIRRTP